jgi:hypothetical protein
MFAIVKYMESLDWRSLEEPLRLPLTARHLF